MDFIGDFNNTSAVDVIAFVKEVVEKFPSLRRDILQRLMSTLGDVRSGKVSRGVLWIVGEYSLEQSGSQSLFFLINCASLTTVQILEKLGKGYVLVWERSLFWQPSSVC